MDNRAVQKRVEHTGRRVLMHYEIPLAELIAGFFDRLKSVTHGYATMDYDFKEYRHADIVRLDLLINGERVEALATMTPRDQATETGGASGRQNQGAAAPSDV